MIMAPTYPMGFVTRDWLGTDDLNPMLPGTSSARATIVSEPLLTVTSQGGKLVAEKEKNVPNWQHRLVFSAAQYAGAPSSFHDTACPRQIEPRPNLEEPLIRSWSALAAHHDH